MERITVKDVMKNEYVEQLIARGNEMLGVLGYTEHSKYTPAGCRPRPG